MYIREEIRSDGYTLDVIMVKSEFETERVGRFNFKNNEGYYKNSDKEIKSFKTLENKIWKGYPELCLGVSLTTVAKLKLAGKEAMKQQTIIWEYQDIARKLKSENSYSVETLQTLFSRATEIEKLLVANNLEHEIIMM